MASMQRKEGFLLKKAVRSLLKDNWKKRWVVVDGATSCLAYYKTPTDKTPILTIPITHTSTVSVTDEHKRANELKLATGAFTFYACAESEASRNEWIATVTAIIHQHTPVKPVPLPPPPPPSMPHAIPGAAALASSSNTLPAGGAGTVAPVSPSTTPAPTFMKLSDLVRKAESMSSFVASPPAAC
jgi:hypothetical protein